MVARATETDSAVEKEIRASLLGLTAGSIVVRGVEIDHIEDLTEALVWQVRLVLDPPASGSWDVTETQQLKHDARRITDDVALQHGASSEGVTSILITTHDAPKKDVAPPDEPEPDERTDIESDVEDAV